jgi:membrane dipeptidase
MEQKGVVIDAHADTLLKTYMIQNFKLLFQDRKPTFHVTRKLLEEGGVDVQVLALFVPSGFVKLGIEITLELIYEARKLEKDNFPLIRSKSDYLKLKENRKFPAMVLSMEGAVALERKPELLHVLFELGVRSLALAWSRSNIYAEGVPFVLKESDRIRGLSQQGLELISIMEELGIVLDVSHLNRPGFDDVVKTSTKPFIASHSNAHQLCPVSRNLHNDQIEAIANAGGVIGINFYNKFLVHDVDPSKASIDNVIEHIRYITDLVGIHHVGLGSDFDGISMTPQGLENVSKVKYLPPLLEKEGYGKNDIRKIMGENLERIFLKVWK